LSGLIAKFSGFSIFKFLRYITEELLVVLAPRRRDACPRLINKMERFGVARRWSAGRADRYSFNSDGTSIFMSMADDLHRQAYTSTCRSPSRSHSGRADGDVEGGGRVTRARASHARRHARSDQDRADRGLALLWASIASCRGAPITNIIRNAVVRPSHLAERNAFDRARPGRIQAFLRRSDARSDLSRQGIDAESRARKGHSTA